MSNAEDLSKELFPLLETDKIGNNPYITYNTEQLAKQEGFIVGYHQAEKDLELTYDDICEIMEIREDVLEMDSYENLYEEILKRFKDFKERKGNEVQDKV